MNNLIKITILMILGACFLISCSRGTEEKNQILYTVQPKSHASILSYSGIIQPLKTIVISSPAEGAVVDLSFQYGEAVKKGQLLYQLSSTKFISDYKNALMQYLKSKSDFNLGQTQLSEAEFLHKNLLISDDDFSMKKSNYYSSRLSLLQARDVLQSLMQQLDVKKVDLEKLTIADFDKITQALHLQMNADNLQIISPADGVILAPAKGEEGNKKIQKGDAIKQGDALALIGDLSGLSITIRVNELVVNHLHPDQAVMVSGVAFPGMQLAGVIRRIDRQGEPSSSGLPNFTVEVIVPTLTAEEQKHIYVGMTAKVDIKEDEKSELMIPINAVTEKAGDAWVTVHDPKKNRNIDRLIHPGSTTQDSVVVLAGLRSGERIVIPHQA